MPDTGCEVLTDPDTCRDIWRSYSGESLPFNDWELRAGAADLSGVIPFFLRDEAYGTVLPLGLTGGMAVFYGGKVYAERNGFLGPPGGEAALLNYLAASGRPFRLLSWEVDPLSVAGNDIARFDVPYNQFWIADPAAYLDDYEARSVPARHAKEFRYLQRKFERRVLPTGDREACRETLERFIRLTVGSFAKRGASSVYGDEVTCEIIMRTCEAALDRSALKLIAIEYNSQEVGLLVLIDEPGAPKATYLLNLYGPSPSDISNAVTCAVIEYACQIGKPVDGLRGAFTLKKKFGFRPEPSYALVNDPRWKIQPQTDLGEAELLALYGRAFGTND